LPAGLILAALVMLVMGFVPWATSSIMVMFVLLFLCGWFQGWAGRRADVRWCTGGRRKSAAVLFRCGTARITSAADPAAAVPAGDGVV
jgi:OPA family glycerol-3-phosphate transporter-like MFS transporter